MEFLVNRAGLRLAADISGPESGTPVLRLHGGGQTRFSWVRTGSALAARGFRAIAVDLRGHGDSEWAADGDYRLETIADDIRDLVASLEHPPFLVGASLGGLTSMLAAAQADPAIARGLVMVDVVPKLEHEGVAEIMAFMRAHADGFPSMEEVAEAVSSYRGNQRRSQSEAGLVRNVRLRTDGRYYWHWDPKLLPDDIDEATRIQEELTTVAANLSIPTLLIRGGMSRVVSMEGVQHFLDMVPQAEFVDIETAGHMIVGDSNDAFNAPLIEFLVRNDRP